MRLQAAKLKLLAAAQSVCTTSGRCDAASDGQLLEQLLATTIRIGSDAITLQVPRTLAAGQGAVQPDAVFDRNSAQVNALTDAPQALSKQGMALGEVMVGLEGQGAVGAVLDMVGDKCLYMTRVRAACLHVLVVLLLCFYWSVQCFGTQTQYAHHTGLVDVRGVLTQARAANARGTGPKSRSCLLPRYAQSRAHACFNHMFTTGTLDPVATAAKAPPAGDPPPASAAALLSGMAPQRLAYVAFVYTDGTACEADTEEGDSETRPREAEVRVVCSPDAQWYMTVTEPGTCRYVISLFAPPLCELPGYALDALHTVVLDDVAEPDEVDEYDDE